jgi:hypothetical protein
MDSRWTALGTDLCPEETMTTDIIRYARMPHGSESGGSGWMNDLPARYTEGERGFERRIMTE